MEVQESEIGGIVVLRVKGRVDSSVAKNLETKIVGAVQQNAAVNVDFAGVSFISTAGPEGSISVGGAIRAPSAAASAVTVANSKMSVTVQGTPSSRLMRALASTAWNECAPCSNSFPSAGRTGFDSTFRHSASRRCSRSGTG